ncbi:MAG: hypothetical protein O8C66_13760 [Candidatus Methanoperedens sp.]|nr:hypothetical protein [Candidatus Methanoperedens sp.]MCZ7371565.1 hypothetical protein [Candidatus Methanoperedens sp.]
MAESPRETEKGLKLKAKMVNTDDLNYTFQVYPVNVDWTYSELESAYRILDFKFKNDSMRQIVRNVLLKYKEPYCDSIRVGSKEYIFEVQISKGIDTDKLKDIFTQIANELKSDISSSKSELESVQKFLEDTEF